MKRFILVMLVTLGFYSCSDPMDNEIQDCGIVRSVPIEYFAYCGQLKENPTRPIYLLINSNEELQKYFTTCDPFGSLPDFTQKRVLGLLSGPKPSSGYEIKIQAVRENDCEILVEYSEKEPNPEEGVLTVITYPSDFVLLPKSNKPIIFSRVKEVVNYAVIGRYSFFCPSDCASAYRIDDLKTIRFLKGNTTSGSYEVLSIKEDFSNLVANIPQEILDLKGQTKEFKNDLIADGGGCFIEYHQGNVVTTIRFTNFITPEKGQENLFKFMNYIYNRISFLDASK